MASVCIICYDEKKHFLSTPCGHKWCTECDQKYRKTAVGEHCVMCRTKFRSTLQVDPPKKPYHTFTDYELRCWFGELPTRKGRRKKYYRALRQHFKTKLKKYAVY